MDAALMLTGRLLIDVHVYNNCNYKGARRGWPPCFYIGINLYVSRIRLISFLFYDLVSIEILIISFPENIRDFIFKKVLTNSRNYDIFILYQKDTIIRKKVIL